MAEDLELISAPAVKCSYCEKVYDDSEKHNMGFEDDKWAVCFKCFRKICNRKLGNVSK